MHINHKIQNNFRRNILYIVFIAWRKSISMV
nr:MAG TPA: hypothetical protein [Caudoviricetes sp.]